MSEPTKIKLSTEIRGEINNESFACRGDGLAIQDEARALTRNTLYFDKLLQGYTPLYNKCWSCVHHKPLALGDEHPIVHYLNRGGRIVGEATIWYPFPNSRIEVESHLFRRRPDSQFMSQKRNGSFTGPTDIVEQLPYTIELSPDGSDRAVAISNPRVRRESGEVIEFTCSERLYFHDGLTLEESIKFRLSGSASFDFGQLIYRLGTVVHANRSEPLAA